MMKNNNSNNKSWSAAWSSSIPAPFSRPTGDDQSARVGPSFLALVLSATPDEKKIRYHVRIDEPITIGATKFAAGQEMTITQWTDETTTDIGAIDRVRMVNCYAAQGKKPGQIFYNCKDVQLEQSWLEACANDAYLAQQSLDAKFILTTREVECDPTKKADGIRSVVVWPNDVSLVPKKTNQEIVFLDFRVQYMKWTAEHVTNNTPPTPVMMEFKLWADHCNELVPGPLDMEDWKAVMSNGRNRVNFAVVCSIDKKPDSKWAPIGGGHKLHVHAFRSDTPAYLLSPSCPAVSRELVEEYVSTKQAAASSPNSSIVNVTVKGLVNAKAFSEFRAMTSEPDALISEADIRDALEAGTVEAVVFFAVSTDDQPPQKKRARPSGNEKK